MRETARVTLARIKDGVSSSAEDYVAVEEPLEIRLEYGPRRQRILKSIAVAMRTPGNDEDLTAGFLWTEGVIEDPDAIEQIVLGVLPSATSHPKPFEEGNRSTILPSGSAANVVTVSLHCDAQVRMANIERNFYTTSSCGVCGKASISALQILCPPRRSDSFQMRAQVLMSLPRGLRESQPLFATTGGLHGAAIVGADGELLLTREDVGRHNAVDKLVGHAIAMGELPLRNRCLLLSGRVSFELMQKAVMAGIAFVAAIGAPSSLAVTVAKNFDVTLVGFLRDSGFNVYSGTHRLMNETEP